MATREDGGRGSAAENLLNELSAMLQGPASADGTTRAAAPDMGADPVLAMPVVRKEPKVVLSPGPSEKKEAPSPLAPKRSESAETIILVRAVSELLTKFEAIEGRMKGIEEGMVAMSSNVESKLGGVESTMKDLCRSVQLLKDRQELFDAQQELAKATTGAKDKDEDAKGKAKAGEANGAHPEPEAAQPAQPVPQAQAASASPAVQQAPPPQQTHTAAPPAQAVQTPPSAAAAVSSPPFGAPAAPPSHAPPPAMAYSQAQGQYGSPAYAGPGGSPYAGGPPPHAAAPPAAPHPPPPQLPVSAAPAAMASGPPASYAPHLQPLPAPVLPPPVPMSLGSVPYGRAPGGGQDRRPPPPRTSQPQSQMSSSRVPLDKVVDDVAAMGFSKASVHEVVRRLTANGQSVDLNIVLDEVMRGQGGGGIGAARPQEWYPR